MHSGSRDVQDKQENLCSSNETGDRNVKGETLPGDWQRLYKSIMKKLNGRQYNRYSMQNWKNSWGTVS